MALKTREASDASAARFKPGYRKVDGRSCCPVRGSVRFGGGELETMRGYSNGSAHVFTEKPYRVWFEIAVESERIENFTCHCLRHTFASRLVMAGVNIRTVAELMGHKSLQMTMRYAHLAPQHTASAFAKLDKAASKADETRGATHTQTSTRVGPTVRGKMIKFPQAQAVQKVAAKPGP